MADGASFFGLGVAYSPLSNQSVFPLILLSICLEAGYSRIGLGLESQGWFVLLHPLRRLRQAGRFDVSSIALSGAIFKIQGPGS